MFKLVVSFCCHIDKGTFTPKTPSTIASRQVLLKMAAEMKKFIFGEEDFAGLSFYLAYVLNNGYGFH